MTVFLLKRGCVMCCLIGKGVDMDLKVKDVAELLHLSEITIRRWVQEGKIPAYRLDHHIFFFPARDRKLDVVSFLSAMYPD